MEHLKFDFEVYPSVNAFTIEFGNENKSVTVSFNVYSHRSSLYFMGFDGIEYDGAIDLDGNNVSDIVERYMSIREKHFTELIEKGIELTEIETPEMPEDWYKE